MVVNIPLESESIKYGGSFNPVMMELLDLAFAQGMCVHQDLFIRGGLDLGWWYNQGDILISSSLVNAVKREASANVPVIALSERLYNYFEGHPDRSTFSEGFDPVSDMFRFYEDDKDHFYFLDYMYLCLNNMDWSPNPDEDAVYRQASEDEKCKMTSDGRQNIVDRWLKLHARIIEKAANRALGRPEIHSKYNWLSKYHNEIVRGFTQNSECVCTVG